MLGEIQAFIGALMAGKEIGKGMIQFEIDIKVREKVVDWLIKFGEVQDRLLKVELENEELRKRLKEKEEWDKTASQYELHSTPGGAVVYRFKETPPHYACPNCWSKQQRQILQDLRNPLTGKFECPACRVDYRINRAEDPPSGGPGWKAFT